MDALRRAETVAKPLPADVAAGEIGIGLPYEKYATFTWAWSWRRTLLLGSIAVPYGALLGVVHGLFAGDLGEGLAVGWRSGFASLLMVGLGPSLAAAVRGSRVPWRTERPLVVGSVVLGMVLALAAGEYAEAFHDRLMGRASTGLARVIGLFAGDVPAHAIVERSAGIAATVALYAIAGGALGLRPYVGEPRRWREHRERRAMDAVRQGKLDAERRLALLQAQVEPHFLFNTLASARSLIRSEPHRAADMVDALAVYLRSTLPRLRETGTAAPSTLGEQFEICRNFLAVMDLRLGGRVTVTVDLPEALAGLPFPPMLLISLVENAVRHGVEPKVGNAHIELRARRIDSAAESGVEVSVIDDGVGLGEGVLEGTGLSNVRAQLRTLFGRQARLAVESRPGGGVRASISIPLDAGATT